MRIKHTVARSVSGHTVIGLGVDTVAGTELDIPGCGGDGWGGGVGRVGGLGGL